MFPSKTAGYSMVELAVALGVIATATATALPRMLTRLDEWRVSGAARYLAARFYDTRIEAITRATEVAMRFTTTNAGIVFTVHVDGNGDGVLTRDIQRNVDWQLHSPELLASQFSGVDFGTIAALPAIEEGGVPPGDDPIRFGTSNMVSFSALGTSSSGTLYIRGRDTQYAIRLVGATARVRTYRFDARSRSWQPV
jgi:type II secretory pathway pseudopilin PulG